VAVAARLHRHAQLCACLQLEEFKKKKRQQQQAKSNKPDAGNWQDPSYAPAQSLQRDAAAPSKHVACVHGVPGLILVVS
jgi:hypothetical protein